MGKGATGRKARDKEARDSAQGAGTGRLWVGGLRPAEAPVHSPQDLSFREEEVKLGATGWGPHSQKPPHPCLKWSSLPLYECLQTTAPRNHLVTALSEMSHTQTLHGLTCL